MLITASTTDPPDRQDLVVACVRPPAMMAADGQD